MATITELAVIDVRFPTSRDLDGSDAMNPDPDYSAAYVVLRTDAGDGLEGHGLTFTIGRGTEVVVAAVEALRPLVVGRSVEGSRPTWAAFWRDLVGDSQLRWIGPGEGRHPPRDGGGRQRGLGSRARSGPACRSGRLLAEMTPGPDRRPRRLPLPDRRADPGRGARDCSSAAAPGRAGARGRAAARRLPGLHDVGRLARLRRRQDPAARAARRSPTAGPGSR